MKHLPTHLTALKHTLKSVGILHLHSNAPGKRNYMVVHKRRLGGVLELHSLNPVKLGPKVEIMPEKLLKWLENDIMSVCS